MEGRGGREGKAEAREEWAKREKEKTCFDDMYLAAGIHTGGRAEIDEANVAINTDEYVLRLDVAVHIPHAVHSVNGQHHFRDVKLGGLLLWKERCRLH